MRATEIQTMTAPSTGEAVIEADLKLTDIYVSQQVRKTIRPEEILELAISILENGLLSRIIVRPTARGFEVIAGECRYRACRILYACGLRQTIGAQIVAADDRRKAILQVSENAKRNDVDPGDEADYMQNVLIGEHGMTIVEISKLFGRTPQTIRNYLAVTNLHPDIRRELDRDTINFTSASIIGSLESHGKQLRALSVMRRRGLKTAALRAFVAELRQENNLFALEAVESPRQAAARRTLEAAGTDPAQEQARLYALMERHQKFLNRFFDSDQARLSGLALAATGDAARTIAKLEIMRKQLDRAADLIRGAAAMPAA